MIVEKLVGGSIPPGFSGAVIEMGDRLLYLVPGDLSKVRSLREKLSQKSIGVFIDASFPGGIGMGKIGRGLKGTGNPFMLDKL